MRKQEYLPFWNFVVIFEQLCYFKKWMENLRWYVFLFIKLLINAFSMACKVFPFFYAIYVSKLKRENHTSGRKQRQRRHVLERA